MDSFISYLLIWLFVIIVIFIVCREYVCWYFKINQLVELLKEIRDLLSTPGKKGKFKGDNSITSTIDEDDNASLRRKSAKGKKFCPDDLVEVNLRDEDGNTMLMEAAKEGDKEAVELLLNKGADVNVRNNGGETALTLAQQEGHMDIVELLKQAGAEE